MSERQVLVKLYARASELAGLAETAVPVAGDASAAAVKRALARQHPALGALLASCVLATDAEFLSDEAAVGGATALHLVPPVSGG